MNYKKLILPIILIILVGYAQHKELDIYKSIQEDNKERKEEYIRYLDSNFKRYDYVTEEVVDKQWGIASWYDYKLVQETDENGLFTGREIGIPCFMAREECYTETKLFAASRKYPRGSVLKVINLDNQKEVYVVVTDEIDHPDRVLDLTSFAFSRLAPLEHGLIDVKIELQVPIIIDKQSLI